MKLKDIYEEFLSYIQSLSKEEWDKITKEVEERIKEVENNTH